jgi:hypothetical protein
MADPTVDELDEFFTASKNVRRPFEAQWYLNMAFHDGRQWMAFDGRQLFEPQLEPWRAKLTDNRLRGMVRKEIARMTKARPQWVGVPATSEDDEIDAARLRERVFEHDWQYLDVARKRKSGQQWARVCGNGFLKITWDSTTGPGRDVMVGPDGKSLKDQYGAPLPPSRFDDHLQQLGLPPEMADQIRQQTKQQTVLMGDPRIDVRTPFEMFPDALATEDGLESCRRIGEEAVYDPEDVYRWFGKRLEPDAVATPGVVEARFGGSGWDQNGRKQGVKVREWWCLPCADYKAGCHAVYVPSTDEILLVEENPYPWLPYVMFRGLLRPGSFWCAGIDDLISPQTELNKSLSQIAENAERIGNPPLAKPSGADFDNEDAWQPGTVLEYQDSGSPQAAPHFLQVPELPGYVQNRPDSAENSLREISHQHEVTSGNVPAGVTAASAINLLQEADDTVLGPDIEDMELTIRDLGKRLLWLRWKYSTDERMLRIAGEDGAWDLEAFRGQMLKNGGENDQVQAGSGLPQSKAAKQAAIQQVLALFVQNGVAVDERRLRRVLRDFEVGGLENMFADTQRDERQVNEENRQLAAGNQLEINAYDNDLIHIAGHEDFQKTARYARLPDPAKATTERHVGAHRARVAQKQLDAQQPPPDQPPGAAGDNSAAAAQNGAPSAPPAPSVAGASQ